MARQSDIQRPQWGKFLTFAAIGCVPFGIIGLLAENTLGWLMVWLFVFCLPFFGLWVGGPLSNNAAVVAKERARPGSTDLAYYKPRPRVDRNTPAGEYKWINWMIGESDVISLLRETTDALYNAMGNPAMAPYIPVLFDQYVEQAAKTGEAKEMWQAEIEALVKRLVDRRQEVGV